MPLLSQAEHGQRVALASGHTVIVGERDGAFRWVTGTGEGARPVRLAGDTPYDLALDEGDPLRALLDADRVTIRRTLATLDRDQLARVDGLGVPMWVKGEASKLLAGHVEAPAPAEEVACPVCTASTAVVLSAKGSTVAMHAGPDGGWCSGSGKPVAKPARPRAQAAPRKVVTVPASERVAMPPAPAPVVEPSPPPTAVQAPAEAAATAPSSAALPCLLLALDGALRAAQAAGVGLAITLTVPPRS